MFGNEDRKALKKIVEKFEKKVEEDSYSFFEGIILRMTYEGFETRIRYDEEYKLFWGRLDNHDTSVVFCDRKIEDIAVKFIKEVKKQ